MPTSPRDPMWNQFRRLLLGTVVECLLRTRVEVAFSSIWIAFDPESDFRVPRFDNYMRFKGTLTATLAAPPDGHALPALRDLLQEAWKELLSVLDLPIGDRLTAKRTQLEVIASDGQLRIHFDLEAD
ncbi:MAG: hypothetical protein MUF54_19075 [Polyangiaceae bacterium]|nr:hypothetical protein [Polyangiaceae bacterium]